MGTLYTMSTTAVSQSDNRRIFVITNRNRDLFEASENCITAANINARKLCWDYRLFGQVVSGL
jgi:hypothetical protein